MVYSNYLDDDDDEMLPKLPNLDSFSTATIDEYYEDIGVWEVAQQIVLRDPDTKKPFIHHRAYSIPITPLKNPFYVREVEIPYEEWPTYYRVETEFQVEEFNGSGEFFRWERGVQTYTLETLKYNRRSSYLNWVRPPSLQSPPTRLDTLQGGRDFIDPITPTEPPDPRLITHPPVTLTLNTGKALGVEVILSNGEIEPDLSRPVYLDPKAKEIPISIGYIKVEYPKGSIVNGKFNVYPSDEVIVTTTAYSIKAIFYGEETYQTTPYPTKLIDDAEEEVLIHPPNTPLPVRLLPPGKSFRQDFWNNPDNKPDPEIKGYRVRKGKQWSTPP
jgi:hypothetical protein